MFCWSSMQLTQIHCLFPQLMLRWCQQYMNVPLQFILLENMQLHMGEFLVCFQVTLPNSPPHTIHVFLCYYSETQVCVHRQFFYFLSHLLTIFITQSGILILWTYASWELVIYWQIKMIFCRLPVGPSAILSCVLCIAEFDGSGSSWTLKYVANFTLKHIF